MKTKSTYSLLVNSYEKGRSIFESAVYGLLVVSAIASIGQFATQSITSPGEIAANSPRTAVVAQATTPAAIPARG